MKRNATQEGVPSAVGSPQPVDVDVPLNCRAFQHWVL